MAFLTESCSMRFWKDVWPDVGRKAFLEACQFLPFLRRPVEVVLGGIGADVSVLDMATMLRVLWTMLLRRKEPMISTTTDKRRDRPEHKKVGCSYNLILSKPYLSWTRLCG